MSLSCDRKGNRVDLRTWLHAALVVCTVTGVLGAASGARAQAGDAGAPNAATQNGGPTVLGALTPDAPGGANAAPTDYAAAPPPQAPGGYGQPQPAYGQQGYVPPVEEAPAVVESMRTDDANADHIVLGSTAFTAPRGSVYFSDYDILFIQGGVAVTDNFQLTATSWLPVVPDQPFFLDLSGKFAFLQTSRFHMAGIASLLVMTNAGVDVPVVGRLGLVGTACITENCYVNASVSALFWFTDATTRAVPVTLNFGLVAKVAGIFSLMAEVNGLAAVGDFGSSSSALFDEGVLIGYGIRLSNRNFGFDLSFVKPIIRGVDEFKLVLGVPWLAFTYRSDALF